MGETEVGPSFDFSSSAIVRYELIRKTDNVCTTRVRARNISLENSRNEQYLIFNLALVKISFEVEYKCIHKSRIKMKRGCVVHWRCRY